jgi:hypothetical protein
MIRRLGTWVARLLWGRPAAAMTTTCGAAQHVRALLRDGSGFAALPSRGASADLACNGAIVTLSGGAHSRNVFWQVAGQATLGTTSDFKGVILSKTLIGLNTGAVMNGRALAQTAVALNATEITQPANTP